MNYLTNSKAQLPTSTYNHDETLPRDDLFKENIQPDCLHQNKVIVVIYILVLPAYHYLEDCAEVFYNYVVLGIKTDTIS